MLTYDHGYALLVGVGADHPFTIRDAERVGEILMDPLRCAYPGKNIRHLLGPEANRQSVVEGLEWLVDCSKKDPLATIVFYYSGHGLASPEALLVLNPCFNADNKPLPERYSTEGLPGEILCRHLAEIVSTKLLVLLDCCYAGAQISEFKSPANEPDFLERLKQGRGRVVLASSAEDEKAAADGRESYFTSALLEALAGYGSFQRDGYARVFQIVDYVQATVRKRSKETQHPILKVSDFDENFPVAFYAGGEPLPRELGPASPLTRVPTELGTEQERAAFKALEQKRDESRRLEIEIARTGDFGNAPVHLKARRKELDDEILEFEARLGLLDQQAPFFQEISRWWSWTGLATLLSALFCHLGTQSAFTGIWTTRPPTYAYLGLIVTSLELFVLFALTDVFMQDVIKGKWWYRIPTAFGFHTIFFKPGFAKLYQAATVAAFFAVPLFSQGHFLIKAGDETVYETSPDKNAEVDLDLRGLDHLRIFFTPWESILEGKYWLGSYTKHEGVTFFPFWSPWFLTIAYAAWVACFCRLLLRLAGLENGKAVTPDLIAWWHRQRRSFGEIRV